MPFLAKPSYVASSSNMARTDDSAFFRWLEVILGSSFSAFAQSARSLFSKTVYPVAFTALLKSESTKLVEEGLPSAAATVAS